MRLPISVPARPESPITVTGYSRSYATDLFATLDHDAVWAHIPGTRPCTAGELDTRLAAGLSQQAFVIGSAGKAVGTSSYFLDPSDPVGVEIGMTLLAPHVWGSGLNTTVKRVMLSAAFTAGAEWVQLRTDERNRRSAAAILKLPGVVEIEPRVEPHWIRPDGTVRTSRMFRVPRSGA